MMEGLVKVSIDINGKKYTDDVEPRLLLVDFIRDIARLKGTHIGCDTTSCGACTILIDGMSVKSCTMFAVEADGRKIQTVESLATDDKLHPLQEAFWEHHALQCGYCTPGQIMAVEGLLRANPNPSLAEIRTAVSGNLCRCGVYPHIFKAAQRAAELKSGQVSA